MSDSRRPKRHRWVKLRAHVYVCRDCGTGKVNAQDARGHWYVTYHLPTGRSIVEMRVPPCAVGPFTARYLQKYAAQLAPNVPTVAETATLIAVDGWN